MRNVAFLYLAILYYIVLFFIILNYNFFISLFQLMFILFKVIKARFHRQGLDLARIRP